MRFEGKEVWGDDPPFAPEAFPAGSFYQRDGGLRGHELGAAEATPEVVEHLRTYLADAARPGKALVLKNPYNTVRAPWLRAALPEARIVAVVRRPLPNVFSLAKKHAENPHVHRGPEEGWWGVKPAGWRDLVADDKVVQSARQWDRVNARLAERQRPDRPHRPLPRAVRRARANRRRDRRRTPPAGCPPWTFPSCQLSTTSTRPAARWSRPTGSSSAPAASTWPAPSARADRLEPFTAEQRDAVLDICGETADRLGLD